MRLCVAASLIQMLLGLLGIDAKTREYRTNLFDPRAVCLKTYYFPLSLYNVSLIIVRLIMHGLKDEHCHILGISYLFTVNANYIFYTCHF
jgi:hypothetical protein